MAERITIHVDGKPVETSVECSVAAAVMRGQGGVRQSVTGQPRGPVCGMGVCFECRVTLDGEAHQRSCQVLCRSGMRIDTLGACGAPARIIQEAPPRDFDVLVVGAGPAGIAAASSAAATGHRVGVVDDNPQAGGQIWRRDSGKPMPKDATSWIARLGQGAIELLARTQIIAASGPLTLLAESSGGAFAITCRRLILACGARERFLPFPGWTLPGVFGAGGLQALVKAGFSVAAKKIVVAGSGPLLLAVAAHLRQRGADVRLIAEQAPSGKLLQFGRRLLWHQPGKIVEALGLRWSLRGIPYRAGAWPMRADGTDHLSAVTLTDGARTWTEPCDALACGFGLVPNLELPMLLGCAIENGCVRVDERQQTSIPGVFAIGELTGIGGLDKALVEGQIAGTQALQPRRAKGIRFVELLADAFRLRDELRRLPERDTMVCRCEDVTYGQLRQCAGWRDAKLQTRCGMGPCQGRMCGPAVEFLFGWNPESVRPPLFPTALGNLGR